MNCQEVKELFSDYLDGRLAPSEVLQLEEHAKGCSACGRDLAQLRATISLMSSLGEIETSPDFLAQVNRKIDSGRNPSRFWGWFVEPMRIKLPLEAAALLLVSTLAFYLYHRSPELSEKSLALPEAKVEPVQEQQREKGAEPSSEAPAVKPFSDAEVSAKLETQPPKSEAAVVPSKVDRLAATPVPVGAAFPRRFTFRRQQPYRIRPRPRRRGRAPTRVTRWRT